MHILKKKPISLRVGLSQKKKKKKKEKEKAKVIEIPIGYIKPILKAAIDKSKSCHIDKEHVEG